jgi:hypothetical protein
MLRIVTTALLAATGLICVACYGAVITVFRRSCSVFGDDKAEMLPHERMWSAKCTAQQCVYSRHESQSGIALNT